MNIFKQIKNSIYNKEYYNSVVLVESFRDSAKYLVKLCLLMAMLGAIVIAVSTPFISRFVKNNLSSVVSGYPNDLVISIKNGNASVNQPQPYFIKLPESMKNIKDREGNTNQLKIDNLIVINTTEPFNLDKFKEYSTLSLLTQKEIIMMSNEGQIQVVSLSKFGNVDISKSWLEQKEKQSHKVLPWMLVALVLVFLAGVFIVSLIINAIILLFYALIVLLVLKFKGQKVSYGRAYQIAIHAITLVLFIGILGNIIKPLDNSLLKFIIFGIICYINFDKVDPQEINDKPLEEEKKLN